MRISIRGWKAAKATNTTSTTVLPAVLKQQAAAGAQKVLAAVRNLKSVIVALHVPTPTVIVALHVPTPTNLTVIVALPGAHTDIIKMI